MSRPFSAFRANARDHRAGLLVAALSAAFGVALVGGVNVLGAYIGGSAMGEHGSVQLAITVVAGIFFVVAVYVGAIVTTNTFATVIAGRTRTIALLRLIGSSARAQRRSVAGEGFAVGLLGSVLGGAAAAVLALVAVRALVLTGVLPDALYPVLSWTMIPPAAIVVLTTWLASWVGSRRVLAVTPIQALGAAQERPAAAVRSRGRLAVSVMLIVAGGGLLTLGLLLGLGVLAGLGATLATLSPYGVLVAMLGGILSFTGIVLAAPFFLPGVLRAVGLLVGRGAAGRLAAANAVRNPERSSRTGIGLVIGVTLITMFVVAASSWQQLIHEAAAQEPGMYEGADGVIGGTLAVFTVLVGFSAVIAACGVVNTLSLSVLQRARELGLLRALGFSAAQVRRMILTESAQLTVASVLTGLVLGTLYGWIGAQSLLGTIPGGGLLAPALPWPFLASIVVAAAALAVLAALAPTRRATRVSPVEALAVE
ncbi:ABC transporter permease [Leifsonia shinshuensis]|uniref:ABC transporter permease n=1 Tax=Leifsonia shinshuensis TaxID=150026 RepID=UPI00285DD0C3|nr:ABC transporter permease [Leifsonia shinshuensis]MDR6970470.1 putative ABC transport system permease protein [Leifsonia shinshuensis]